MGPPRDESRKPRRVLGLRWGSGDWTITSGLDRYRRVWLSTDAEAELPPVEEVAAEEAQPTPAEFFIDEADEGRPRI